MAGAALCKAEMAERRAKDAGIGKATAEAALVRAEKAERKTEKAVTN